MGGGREGGGLVNSSKMSSAMALVVSSRRIMASASSSSSTTTNNTATNSSGTGIVTPQKRRSLAECVSGGTTTSSSNSSSTQNHQRGSSAHNKYSLHKRPRTSWGKPHSNPSLLLCSPLLSSTNSPPPTPTDHDRQSFSNSHFIVPTTPSSVFFVKTEPLQNLAVFTLPGYTDQTYGDFEDDFDEPRLHQVPSFFPIEHLLLDMSGQNNAHTSAALPLSPTSPGCFPPSLSSSACVSTSSPISPLSGSAASSPIYSATDEYSISGDLKWPRGTDCLEDESCDFLSNRFYEIETEMRCIMGESASLDHHHDHEHDLITELPNTLIGSAQCAVKLVVPKLEEVAPGDYSQSTSTIWELSSTSRTTQESDEEYRIDLTDFELEQGDSGSELNDIYEQKPSVSNAGKLTLMLNYEDVINAWSDRGPPFSGTSWPETTASPEEVELDLAVSTKY